MTYQDVKNLGNDRGALLLVAAFAAVYIFWGSTYLAIKYAIETLPPFLMAGSRFVVAGGILYGIARLSPDFETPKLAHWRTSIIVGTLLLLGGNGGVVFAQKYISSSLAALLVASEPFFIVLLSWFWLKAPRPSGKVLLGLIIGFAGVALLITGQGGTVGAAGFGSMQLIAMFAIVGAAALWATGSIYGLRAAVPSSAILTAGMQMISGGAVLLITSGVTGEMASFSLAEVSSRSLYGLAYLTVFGSLVGFTAYSWLLKNARPAMVATYAYINPVIAVFLGWVIAGERMSGQTLLGAAVVVGSVVLITSQKPLSRNKKVPEASTRAAPGTASAPTYST